MADDAAPTGPSTGMRVVEVVHGLGAGGLERALIERLRHAPVGTQTTIVSTDPAVDALAAEVEEAGADVIGQRLSGWRGRGALVRAIDGLGPDVILVHTPRNAVQLLTGPTRPIAPVVSVVHNVPASPRPLLEPALHLALRRANPHARLGIAVSARAARGHQASGLPVVVVVYPGVHERTAGAAAAGPDPWPTEAGVRVLVAGRLVAEKRPDLVVEAIADAAPDLRRAGVQVAFVGAGPMRAGCERLAGTRNVTDLVSFHGHVPRMQSVFERADVVVIASRYEGGPLTLHEGLVHGCRIVSTDVGVARESLADDPEHRLLPARAKIGELAAALRAVAQSGPVATDERNARALRHVDRTSSRATPAFYTTLTTVLTLPAEAS